MIFPLSTLFIFESILERLRALLKQGINSFHPYANTMYIFESVKSIIETFGKLNGNFGKLFVF